MHEFRIGHDLELAAGIRLAQLRLVQAQQVAFGRLLSLSRRGDIHREQIFLGMLADGEAVESRLVRLEESKNGDFLVGLRELPHGAAIGGDDRVFQPSRRGRRKLLQRLADQSRLPV